MIAEPNTGDTYAVERWNRLRRDPKPLGLQRGRDWAKLTIAAWMRPDVEEFEDQEGTNYVHWMGKGTQVRVSHGDQEWVCRMYSTTTTDDHSPAALDELLRLQSPRRS